MKKLVVLLVLVLSLCACGNWEIEIRNPYDSSEGSSESESSESDSSESSEESSAPERESESSSESEPEPEPEREPRPDSDFGIEPASKEEAEEFSASEKAVDELIVFASWVGEKDFESPKEVFSSYVLWWFGEELYDAMGGEDALYDDGHFFKVDTELAEKYFKRYFGMDCEDVGDEYNFDDGNGNYRLPVSGGGAKNRFISAEVKSVEENRVVYTVLLLIRQDETGKIFANIEMTCDVLKDGDGMFLRLVSNEVTEEFGESSFEDQAKYLTVRVVESLSETYVANGIRVTDSKSAFDFICRMQKTLYPGEEFDAASPYLGDFYRDGKGYHLPLSSMKEVAKEVFGIGNFVVTPDESFVYDEEKKEYYSTLGGIEEPAVTAANLTAHVNGDIYSVRFTLMVREEAEDGIKWTARDRYRMNFRLIDGSYLRFIGFAKA